MATLAIVAGVGLLAWALVVWQWQDPFTALYTTYEQHRLNDRFARVTESFRETRPTVPHATRAARRRTIAQDAAAFRRTLREGQPVARIKIKRLGLNMIVVQGTSHGSLEKGPGHYAGSFLPGQGELIYVAGHRTTYRAPFAHIDDLRPGDSVVLQLPYGTFRYRVTGHRIVAADDLAVLRSHHREVLVLQACHPRFFASHRYLVYADIAPNG